MRAIITFARGWNALAATRSLGRKGIEVVTGDEHPLAAASLSRYSVAHFLYPNPDREPEAFLDRLEAAIREHAPSRGPYVLMPFHKETYLIARHRQRFEPLIQLAIPSIEQIDRVHDKGALAEFCQGGSVPIPRTVVPRTPEEFRRAAAGFSYPAFVKVRQSAAAVGVRKVLSPGEAWAAFLDFVGRFGLGEGQWPLLQEGVGGDDYCATFLFERGEPRAAMTYHNLRSFPARSGTGVLRETVQAPGIERIGRDLLSSLKWHGVAEIDFRWSGRPDDSPWLIEVNPRFWGGLPQAVESGWDYPHLLYRLAADGKVDSVPAHDTDVRTQTPIMGLLSTLHEIVHDEARGEALAYVFRKFRGGYVKGNRRKALRRLLGSLGGALDLGGRLGRAGRLLADHRNAVSDVFAWSDPRPALGLLYPLAVFLKHGKVSTELLVSEGPARESRNIPA